MNARPSAEFVWALSPDDTDPHLLEVRTEMRGALEREYAPVRIALLLIAGLVYVVPLLLLQDLLLEAFAGTSEWRAKMGMAILLGISTLVVLPLLGYLSHLSAESKALVEAARRFMGVAIPSSKPGHVLVRFSSVDGSEEVLVKASDNVPPGTPLSVYAIPEETNLAAVEFENSAKCRIRLGLITRSSS